MNAPSPERIIIHHVKPHPGVFCFLSIGEKPPAVTENMLFRFKSRTFRDSNVYRKSTTDAPALPDETQLKVRKASTARYLLAVDQNLGKTPGDCITKNTPTTDVFRALVSMV